MLAQLISVITGALALRFISLLGVLKEMVLLESCKQVLKMQLEILEPMHKYFILVGHPT